MPGRDQTGPRGAGSMTGRATGRCKTNTLDEMGGRGRGAGRRMRCGMGRGRQQGFGAQGTRAGIEGK